MREILLTTVTAAVLAVTACSKSDSPTGPGGSTPPATPVGNYTLSSIDAKVMPYTMFAETGYTLEVSSGTLSVTSAGRWVSKIVSRETVAGNVSTYSDSTFGTWTQVAGSTTASFLNAETNVTTNVTWTAADVTVNELDGTTTHKVLYKRN